CYPKDYPKNNTYEHLPGYSCSEIFVLSSLTYRNIYFTLRQFQANYTTLYGIVSPPEKSREWRIR
ncbi:TPA: hypothetical protein ACHJPX_004388, partial [Escherichia coli]